ncbi:hypothetical protein XELAEV_18000642mg [Xenopus laevis]|nr:hypothetical protein XELAEV_18000642mg [Xenopus laevis]
MCHFAGLIQKITEEKKMLPVNSHLPLSSEEESTSDSDSSSVSSQKNILEQKLAFCTGLTFLPFGTGCILFAFKYSATRKGNQAQRSTNSTGTILAT